jgi:outer membrane immunogenic protein
MMVSLFAGSALAADLGRPITKAPPAPIPYYNWTGFYIGLNVGGAFTSSSGHLFGSGNNLNGVAGGIQAGYNWQVNNFVFGIETDFQGSSQSSSFSGVDGTVGGAGPFTISDRIRYFGTVRGRLGLAQDRWLLYVTGGYAYQNFSVDVTTLNWGVASASTTRNGWTVGGGVEYAFAGPWTARLEYLYIDTSSSDFWFTGNHFDRFRAKNNVVRVGVNYRF